MELRGGGPMPQGKRTSKKLSLRSNPWNVDGDSEPTSIFDITRCCSVFFFLSALFIIAGTFPLLGDYSNYANVRKPFLLADAPLKFEFVLPFFVLFGGIVVLLSAFSLIYGHYNTSKYAVITAMVACLLGCGLVFFAAITLQTTLSQLINALTHNPVTSPELFTATDKSIMDLTAAVFNQCCLKPYDSLNYTYGNLNAALTREFNGGTEILDLNQRAVRVCDESSFENTCPSSGADRMFPAIVQTILGSFESVAIDDLLCHCITDEDRYNSFITIIQDQDLCSAYRKLTVPNADDRIIPVLDLSFSRLMSLLGSIYPEISSKLPIGTMAYVGKILPAEQIYQESAEDIGFSCGLGYAKADALVLFFYVMDKTRLIYYISLVGACLGVMNVVLLWLYWSCSGRNDDENDLDQSYGVARVSSKKPPKTSTGPSTNNRILDQDNFPSSEKENALFQMLDDTSRTRFRTSFDGASATEIVGLNDTLRSSTKTKRHSQSRQLQNLGIVQNANQGTMRSYQTPRNAVPPEPIVSVQYHSPPRSQLLPSVLMENDHDARDTNITVTSSVRGNAGANIDGIL